MSDFLFEHSIMAPPPEAASQPTPQPTPNAFELRFLQALAEATQAPQDGGAHASKDVVAFLHDQRSGLPHLLPQMLNLATWMLDLSTLATRGRRFHRLALADRVTVLRGWRNSRLGPIRNFMKFHDVYMTFFSNWSIGAGAGR